MAVEITMPQLSDTMDQGTILTWLKKEGDTVDRGDELAEVGTDKADLPIESFHQGTLLKIYAAEGTTVQVGEVIAVVGEAGEAVPEKSTGAATAASSEPVAQASSSNPSPAPSSAPASTPAPAPVSAAAPVNGSQPGRIKASPLAKKLAAAKGLDLSSVQGSGEGGRIVKRDVESAGQGSAGAAVAIGAAAAVGGAAVAVSQSHGNQPSAVTTQAPLLSASSQPLSRMRQTIAARMVEATSTIPHFYLTSAIEMDGVVKLRKSLKSLPHYDGLTFNHVIIKAVALALRKFPRINSFYSEGNMVQPGNVNIGIITAVEDGLLIPVLKNADQAHLADIVDDAKGLVNRARTGRPKGDDLTGASFCISNVGALPIESFTAVISPGNGGILAVGQIADEVVASNGEPSVKKIMRVTLSVDHRIIDGVMGAEFLAELKTLLEDPVLLLA